MVANDESVKLTQDEEGLVSRFGMTPDQARVQSAKNKESRRQLWLETAIDPWAKKHGITRLQAISVLFCDNTTEGVTNKDAYWAEGNDFSGTTMAESNLAAWVPLGARPTHKSASLAEAEEHPVLNVPSRKGGMITIDAGMLAEVLERFNVVCTLAARLCNEIEDHPEQAAEKFNTEELRHHAISDYSTEIRQEMRDLVDDLQEADVNPQKIVVVIEGGNVREVLAAQGGFSVAVIDYDKNADLDDLIVIPQGDGEKNAYALAAIHEPEVTDAARVNELYSAVVEAKPAAEDEDSPRPRL